MNNLQSSTHKSSWPAEDLESVSVCPACKSATRTLAHEAVEDLAFHCAPGSWQYWQCEGCRSLYLDPRPTISSIGKAYGSYYTHDVRSSQTIESVSTIQRLKNECLYHWLGVDCGPRFHIKSGILLTFLKPFFPTQFPLSQLANLPTGELLDVGCGNGELIAMAKTMGWRVQGLELDVKAVEAARSVGLNVQQGSYEYIVEYKCKFDCVICSHVIEHVHDPIKLLTLLLSVVKPGGSVFISYPNPQSIVRLWFGKYWRGIEAPRHLSLVSREAMISKFIELGITNFNFYATPLNTVGESLRLRFNRKSLWMRFVNKAVYVLTAVFPMAKRQDFIELSFKTDSNLKETSMVVTFEDIPK